MDILRQESIDALTTDDLLSPEQPWDWINFGGYLLEKIGRGINRLNANEKKAKTAAEVILGSDIFTQRVIVGYHGTYNDVTEGGLTDKYLSVSLCMGVALEFGDHIVKVIIPPGVPAFYISAVGIISGENEPETEMEILLPQGRWTHVKEIDEPCGCGLFSKNSNVNCSRNYTHVIEAHYEPL